MNFIESVRSEESKSYLDTRSEEVFKDPPILKQKVEEQEITIQKLLEENIKLDANLVHDSKIITDQVKRIKWLEYMIYIRHFLSTSEEIALWDQQTKPVFDTVFNGSRYSDEVPIYKEEWYE